MPLYPMLFHGAEHSARNVEAIRQWGEDKASADTFNGFVEEWRERGFLTKADAQKLMRPRQR